MKGDALNKPPAFQFYASDYLSSSKVQRMSLEEQGAYVRLLCYCWEDGSIPSNFTELAKLCNITRRKIENIWPHLSDCFQVSDIPGRLVNAKLEAVRLQQIEHRQRQVEHGRIGAEKRWGSHSDPTIPPLGKNSSSTSTPTSEEETPIVPCGDVAYSADFEEFLWKPYPRKTGKGAAYKAWNKIRPSNGTREAIRASIEAHIKTPKWREDGGRYIPNPSTFLNQRRWEDEPTIPPAARNRLVF